MIVFSLSVVVPPARRADFPKGIRGLLEPTRVAPGCIGCRLFTDCDDPYGFMLAEEWAGQAALDWHLTSGAFRKLVAAVELSARPLAIIRFDSVAESVGIEVIAAARGVQDLL